jgi:hypothetical protein
MLEMKIGLWTFMKTIGIQKIIAKKQAFSSRRMHENGPISSDMAAVRTAHALIQTKCLPVSV